MAIFYQAKQMKNPKDSSATPLYYARIKSVGVVDESELVNRISARSGVSEGIVASVLRDSMNEVVDLVTLGYRVKLPALGNIYTTLSSEGEETADLVNSDSVKRVNIRLFPSVSFKTKVATRSKFTNFNTVTNENAENSTGDDTGDDTGNNDRGSGTGGNPL